MAAAVTNRHGSTSRTNSVANDENAWVAALSARVVVDYVIDTKGSFTRPLEWQRLYSCSFVMSCTWIVSFEISSISALENRLQSSSRYLRWKTCSERLGNPFGIHQTQSLCICPLSEKSGLLTVFRLYLFKIWFHKLQSPLQVSTLYSFVLCSPLASLTILTTVHKFKRWTRSNWFSRWRHAGHNNWSLVKLCNCCYPIGVMPIGSMSRPLTIQICDQQSPWVQEPQCKG